MESYKNFRHATPIQIRFKDIDSFQHVNNANYLTFVELSRYNYFREAAKVAVKHEKMSVIMASVKLDFLYPIQIQDELVAYSRTSRIGTKSFDIECVLVVKKANKFIEAGKALTIMVAYDYEKNSTIALPEEWIQLIRDFEQNPNL